MKNKNEVIGGPKRSAQQSPSIFKSTQKDANQNSFPQKSTQRSAKKRFPQKFPPKKVLNRVPKKGFPKVKEKSAKNVAKGRVQIIKMEI